MKIADARQAYSAQLRTLQSKKQMLNKLLEGGEAPENHKNFDRVKITEQLSVVEEQYNRTQKVMEQISQTETLTHNLLVSEQQGEAMKKAADDMIKIITIARRLMKGDIVPYEDEKKLMEYDGDLYMMAKNAAMMARNKKPEEHDSLWDEEESEKPEKSIDDIVADTEISVPAPEAVMAAAEGSMKLE